MGMENWRYKIGQPQSKGAILNPFHEPGWDGPIQLVTSQISKGTT
jgi:hypothetical protein